MNMNETNRKWVVMSGQKYMLGHSLEKANGNIKSKKYKPFENKTTNFFMRVLSIVFCELWDQ